MEKDPSTLPDTGEEETLRQEAHLCSAIMNTAGALVVVLDRQGRIIRFNRACEAATGYTFDEVKGRNLLDTFLVPEEAGAVARIFEELKEGRFPNEFENHWITKSGGIRLIAWSNTALFNDQGEVEYVIGTGIDITERKQAVDWNRIIIQTAMDGFWLTDLEGRFLDVNDAYCELTGYSREELLAMTITDVEAMETPEETEEHIRKIKQAGRDRFETRHRRKDGRIVDVEVSVNYTEVGGGRLFVFVRDITERKKALEEINLRNTELKAANTELETFSYSVSHDLRSPLIAIVGLTRMVLERHADKADEKCRQFLNTILNTAEHTKQLIDDLLAFFRFGHQQLNSTEIDMARLAHEVSKELEAVHPGRILQFVVHPLPPALGDSMMIRQVLVNLLSNAIKFTAPREVAVIELHGSGGRGENVYSVKDNGIGFEPAHAEYIFEPFKRLHASEEGGFEGFGIGLALVNRIVQRHNGRTWAEGKKDKGATFYFTLPKPDPGAP
jgi:PAS domain S-box-containing protein